MNIRATHNFFLYGFFRFYTLVKLKLNFSKIIIKGTVADKNLPILVIANHISWWDGFWVMYLNMKLFHRKFWFMMLEEELEKNSFFKRTGGYPVAKGSRAVIESLKYTRELLSVSRNLVLMFPQGRIESMYKEKLVFERGIERIIREQANEIQVLFIFNLVEYFSDPRPELTINLMDYSEKNSSTEELQNAYNLFRDNCLNLIARR